MSVSKFGLDPNGQMGFSDDDVVTLVSKDFGLESMTKISRLTQAIEQWSKSNSNNKGNEYQWFIDQGCRCEVLRVNGGGWQKGRFRVRLEFIPDDPESFMGVNAEKPPSPLDDLRSDLDI